MKILHRYILSEILLNFVSTLSILIALLLTVRFLRLASLVINKGVSLGQVGMVFISLVPTFLEIAVPLATLLAVLLAFARLSGDSEIVIMRASGASLYQIMRPVVIFGLSTLVLSLYVSVFLKPWGYKRLATALFEIARTQSTAGLESGVFQQLGNLTVYTDSIDHQTGALKNVLVDDRRDPARRKITTAERGTVQANTIEQTINFVLQDGEIHENDQDRYVVTRYKVNTIALEPDELYGSQSTDPRDQRPRELGSTEIGVEIASVHNELRSLEPEDDKEQETKRDLTNRLRSLRIERISRFCLPLSALLLALCAMPLGIHPPRTHKTWGVGLSLTIGLGMFILYFALYSVGIGMSEAGTISPFLGLCTPNIVLALMAIFMIRRVGTEDWQSISEGMQSAALRVFQLFERVFR